ncbi:MAG TPA: M20 family metallopeptidase [Candidatus Polarisedimenticolia bacterium]|jgi:glutamate carboxypeptidase|nr:M20 family metallopeptidase [Candidatus Polarisedimenticolia bacterium]
MSSQAARQSALTYLAFCQQHEGEMMSLLRKMVEIESPSDDKAAVDRMGSFLAEAFGTLGGGQVTFYPQEVAGNHLKADFAGRSGKPVLLLGHFDTVWPLGTLAKMPFRMEAGRAFGPGVYDMKAGIAMMVFAMRAIKAAGHIGHRPVTILLDTDEEVGSTTGRPVVEATAKDCEAVLVLEPSQGPQGHLKTSRKGVGDITIRVRGRASHSGVDFEKGQSAIVELARQLLEIVKFTDSNRGITVNPGVIQGGTRSNVVAAEAWAEVDLRVVHAADAALLEHKFAALKPFNPECSIEISGGMNRPPMERTEGTARLFEIAREIAGSIGLEIAESSTGGGSDGNFTSALGIPTLDGLGALGEGAHATNESVVIQQLPQRTALLAGLIRSL